MSVTYGFANDTYRSLDRWQSFFLWTFQVLPDCHHRTIPRTKKISLKTYWSKSRFVPLLYSTIGIATRNIYTKFAMFIDVLFWLSSILKISIHSKDRNSTCVKTASNNLAASLFVVDSSTPKSLQACVKILLFEVFNNSEETTA